MQDSPNFPKRSQVHQLTIILLFALLLRLTYQAGMTAFGGSFDNGSDSGKYLEAARSFVTFGIWPATDRLPLYTAFIASVFKTVGSESLRAVVSIQAVFDMFSVLAIGLSARAFSKTLTIPAAATAAILPNFLVHASYILQENLFLLFLSWALCALLWSLKSQRTILLLTVSGVLFGMTLWTRISLTYFPLVLVPTLAIALRVDREWPWYRCITTALIPAFTMFLMATPLLWHNYQAYGYVALSSQSGDHLLNWIYGCLATSWPCADRIKMLADIRPIVADYARSIGGPDANPFAISAFMQNLALQRILELPFSQISLGMAWGAFKNLMQTGFYQVLVQFKQPLTFVSAMPGGDLGQRVIAFAAVNKTNPFMIMWTVSQVILVLSRAIQTLGVITGLRQRQYRGMTMLLLVLIAYTLALNGPVADPKYRIPFEPALVILFALGIAHNPTMVALRQYFASLPSTWKSAR